MTAVTPEIRALMDAHLTNNPLRLVEVIDYLLVTTEDHGGRTPAGHSGPIELVELIWIERLDSELAERLLRAGDLCGENFEAPRQYHAVHAYVRRAWAEGDVEPPDHLYRWDAAGRLYPCVQLSRLIRDNNVSTERAVRRLVHADGSERLVPFDGYESHVAYRLYPSQPGWLDVDEAAELRSLLDAYWNGPRLPERVGRALRRVDSITRERYLEDAVPLVVAGFESLVKTMREYARAQFSQRVPALAAEVGVAITIDECGAVYDDRSALVHGAWVDLSIQHVRNTFEKSCVAAGNAPTRSPEGDRRSGFRIDLQQ